MGNQTILHASFGATAQQKRHNFFEPITYQNPVPAAEVGIAYDIAVRDLYSITPEASKTKLPEFTLPENRLSFFISPALTLSASNELALEPQVNFGIKNQAMRLEMIAGLTVPLNGDRVQANYAVRLGGSPSKLPIFVEANGRFGADPASVGVKVGVMASHWPK